MPIKSDRPALLTPARPKSGAGDSAPCAACPVRDFAVCGALTPAELDRIGGEVHRIYLDTGVPLVDEGETERNVYSVTQGCLKSYKLLADGRRQITGFLFPGDFLGLTRSDTYTATVEAVTPATLCRLERKELDQLSRAIPNLDRRLHELASETLAELQDHLLLLGRKTAQERVASFLLTLSRRAVERGSPANPVDVSMSRDDIADFLGLTTETVSRTMTRLRSQNLIVTGKDKTIDIVDADALAKVAEGL